MLSSANIINQGGSGSAFVDRFLKRGGSKNPDFMLTLYVDPRSPLSKLGISCPERTIRMHCIFTTQNRLGTF